MKTLSFVIPVFNEEKRIKKTIKALKKGFSFSGLKLKEIIFVDDGSTDKTKSIIQKSLGKKAKIISYQLNRGKGFAVRTGMLASTADYTLFFDADMATPLSEFKKFLPFLEQGIPVIIGTRKNGQSTVIKHQPKYREILGKAFTLLANIILNTWVTDFTCGFKAFSYQAKEDIFSQSKIDRWGYDAEILFLAKQMNFAIAEKAVLWSDDHRTKVNLVKDLPRTLTELFQIRLNHLSLSFLPRLFPASVNS